MVVRSFMEKMYQEVPQFANTAVLTTIEPFLTHVDIDQNEYHIRSKGGVDHDRPDS